MKIIDYQIVCEENIRILEEKIKEMIKKGWQPLGGICATYENDINWYHQAMVKYEEAFTVEQTRMENFKNYGKQEKGILETLNKGIEKAARKK